MTAQTVLIIVIIVLSLLLIFVGFQVLLIILDLRRAVKRLNGMLEDAVLGGGLLKPDKLTGIVELFRKSKKMQGYGQQERKV